ncbi:MAG: T9SS type A sorting domain-containing protein [bacterium]|nr:T9SS type A sorting domain-containing protein [bacterium]
MKSLLLPFLIIHFYSNGQNDSLLPNIEAGYQYYTYQINNPPGQQWQFFHLSTYNFNLQDTLTIFTSAPVGQIAMDGNKVYAKIEYLNGELDGDYSQDFHLLYDYDLQIGDTAYQKNGYPPAILQSITSFDMDGHLVPHFHFSNGDSWIKGIGSTKHPFFPFVSEFEISYLYCSSSGYYLGDFPLDFYSYYPGNTHPYCQLNLEENQKETDIVIAPNPTSTVLSVINESPDRIEIYTMDGKLLKSNAKRDQISVQSLSKGLYLAKVCTNNKWYTFHFQKK